MPRGPKGEKRPADVIGQRPALSETVMDWVGIVEAMDADAPAKKRGSYKKSSASGG
jgi:hypothetical protein